MSFIEREPFAGGGSKLLSVLSGRSCATPPVWMMRQAGRYLPEYRAVRSQFASFLDLCYSPEWAAEVTLQPIRRFGFDAAILFSDILVVPDALGQKVQFVAGEGPRLEAITTEAGLAALDPGRVAEHLAPVFETVARVRQVLDPETALLGFCGAPWTVATYMVGGSGSADQRAARQWAYREPDAFASLIDILVESSIDYLSRQIQAGADAVQVFDTWAGSLGDGEFERWACEPVKRIVDALRARHPDTPIIGFPKGAAARLEDYVRETGVDALGLDWTVPLEFARDRLQPLAAVQGNVDPIALLAGGEGLDRAVDKVLETLSAGPLIFNLGHGILPETPVGHVERMLERVRG